MIGEAAVQIFLSHGEEFVHMVLKEVVRARQDAELDLAALLGPGALDHAFGLLRRADLVMFAVDDDAGRGARREEGKVIKVRRR